MGTAFIRMKIMPSSPEADLEDIKKTAESMIIKNKGKNCRFEEEPIAFGLKAIIVFFAFSEEEPLEHLEEKLKKIENVNSVQVIDMRRAIG